MRGPEGAFQDKVCKKLRSLGFKVIKQDPSIGKQKGIPDLLILKEGFWGMLECKRAKNAQKQPGQQEWIDFADKNSYGRFIYPENYDEVMGELEQMV